MSTDNQTRNPSGGPAFPRPHSQDSTGEFKSHAQKGISAALFVAAHALNICNSDTPEDIAVESLDIANAILDEHHRRYGF